MFFRNWHSVLKFTWKSKGYGIALKKNKVVGLILLDFKTDYPVLVIKTMWYCHKDKHQFSSVAQSCPALCDPRNCSTPGLPVHHQLPEFTQTHVHRVCDAIQPSHPLLSPSPPAPNPSQHQSLFQWVNSAWGGQSTGVSASASFPPKKSQGWSPLEWIGWVSLQSQGLSRDILAHLKLIMTPEKCVITFS